NDQRERKIDKKYSSPGDMLDQPSAEHGPDSCSDRAKTRPGSNRATAFVLRKRAADNGETARDEKRRAQSLKCAGGNQLMNVRNKSASHRRGGARRAGGNKLR